MKPRRTSISTQIKKSRQAHGLEKPRSTEDGAILPITTRDKKFAQSKEDAKQIWLEYFKKNNWLPLNFQTESWQWFEKGCNIIISVPTGSGKTLAAYGGPFIQMALNSKKNDGYSVIYITPLRALVRDIQFSLARVSESTGISIYIEGRSGDLKIKADEKKHQAQVLVTTPESLSILLARKNAKNIFSQIQTVIVDEAHEIFLSKRGSLLELDLAYLRTIRHDYQSIIISATIANPFQVAQKVKPNTDFKLVDNATLKRTKIRLLDSSNGTALGFFGFGGIRSAEKVIHNLSHKSAKILFANTRAQAELWYSTLQELNKNHDFKIALHHSSIDKAERVHVENELKAGKLNLIIATSSLELGVDFPSVESVFQVGTSKKVTRAIQRAGRGFHSPEKIDFLHSQATQQRKGGYARNLMSELIVIPTNIFDIFEIEALNKLVLSGKLEPVISPLNPIDVLTQYLQTRAIYEGFTFDKVKAILQDTSTFSSITDETIQTIIDFLVKGGPALSVYPHFRKIDLDNDGKYKFTDQKMARRHLFNIGTIVDSSSIKVKYLKGGYIGNLDEIFVAKLMKGDVFSFAGKSLEYVNIKDMVLNVKLSQKKTNQLSTWNGNPFSISMELAEEIRESLSSIRLSPISQDSYWSKILHLQSTLSIIPRKNEVLIERVKTRDGFHTFFYLFEGRLSHEGIGHLLAYRFSRNNPTTFSVSCNDYGIELLSANQFPSDQEITNAFKDLEKLKTDIINSFNFPELSKRKFREIASVAGMIYPRIPGKNGIDRHLQMGTGLLFDVLKKYDPMHPLILQAESEVLEIHLDITRITKTFKRINQSKFIFCHCKNLTPFSFPIYLERVKSSVSSEIFEDRIARIHDKILMVAHAHSR